MYRECVLLGKKFDRDVATMWMNCVMCYWKYRFPLIPIHILGDEIPAFRRNFIMFFTNFKNAGFHCSHIAR